MRHDCEATRDLLHRELDGERLEAAERSRLEVHLATCSGCARSREELASLRGALEELPQPGLPHETLEAVLARTSRRQGWTWALDWRAAAAAAAVALAVWGLWPGPQYSDAELERAAAEARLVLKLTSQALDRSGRTAFKDVLAEEVSPALRHLPMPRAPGEGRDDGC